MSAPATAIYSRPVAGTPFAPWTALGQPQASWRAVTRFRKQLSSGALHLLRYLFDCCRHNTSCWPHVHVIAADLNCTEDHVRRLARQLENASLLRVTHRGPQGNLYELLWHDEYNHALHPRSTSMSKKPDNRCRGKNPTSDVGYSAPHSLYEDSLLKTQEKLASGRASNLYDNSNRISSTAVVVAPSDGEPNDLQEGLVELQRQFPAMITGRQTLNAQTAATILQKARQRNATTPAHEVLKFVRDRVVLNGRHWDTWGGVVHMVHNDYPGLSHHRADDPPVELARPLDGHRFRPHEHFPFTSDSESSGNIRDESPEEHLARAQALLRNLNASTSCEVNHGSPT